MQLLFTILSFLLVGAPSLAWNDWTIPCHDGKCSWDLPLSGGSSGTLYIQGDSRIISDITTASGWHILDCDPNTTFQDIRLVCTDEHCGHLFEGGAEGKIVRVPDGCGPMPFARVSKHWIAEDQSMPKEVMRKRSVKSLPHVRSLSLDTNYSAAASSGEVHFVLHASSHPMMSTGPMDTFIRKRDLLASRSSVSVTRLSIGDSIRNITHLPIANTFNASNATTLPININQTATLFSTSIHCVTPGNQPVSYDASASTSVSTCASAEVGFGVVAAGTLIPPVFSEFAIFAGLNGDINTTLQLAVNAAGTFELSDITLFEVPLAGVVIPGILTLGPTFKAGVGISAELEVDLDMEVGLAYSADNAKVVFPPGTGNNTGGFTFHNSPPSLAIGTSVSGDANFTAHLIPSINVGVDAFNGYVSAEVFLSLDASATLELSGNLSVLASSDDNVPTNSSAQACVDIRTGLDVSTGLEGSLFGIVNMSKDQSLFSRSFDLWKSCPAGNASTVPATSTTTTSTHTSTTPSKSKSTSPTATSICSGPSETDSTSKSSKNPSIFSIRCPSWTPGTLSRVSGSSAKDSFSL
ncbi:hypothetical protein OF83DRAFT_713042 [Amylostereum chailletii]|nr:hypothetical protein OF83DRAFT_713042 [Amylostereum chailletii]